MRKDKGFSVIEVLLILAIVAVIGFVGWYVVDKRSNQTTSATDTSMPSDNTTPAPQTEDPNEGYLVVKEWGIRLKEGPKTQDALYVINDDHKLWLTTQKYIDEFGCTANGETGQIIRGKAGYDVDGFGTKIEDIRYAVTDDQGKEITVAPTKIGDYYYVWLGPQAACTEPTDANRDALTAYTEALADLAYPIEASE